MYLDRTVNHLNIAAILQYFNIIGAESPSSRSCSWNVAKNSGLYRQSNVFYALCTVNAFLKFLLSVLQSLRLFLKFIAPLAFGERVFQLFVWSYVINLSYFIIQILYCSRCLQYCVGIRRVRGFCPLIITLGYLSTVSTYCLSVRTATAV